VPVLTGNNLHEEFSFVGGAAATIKSAYTPQSYPTLLSTAFGASAGNVATRYPLTAYPSAGAAFASLITDDSWACPTLLGSHLLARRTRVYEYEFADPYSPNVSQVHAPGIPQGSAHATELPYLFDLGGKNLLTTAASRRLSQAIIAYWTSFARTGQPTAPREPRWSAQSSTGHDVLGLDASVIRSVDLSAEHQCGLWQTINPQDRP
jgi:para-nitrobenzyl esterase